jgi:hypothetical protein
MWWSGVPASKNPTRTAIVRSPVTALTSKIASVPDVDDVINSCAHASDAAPPAAGGYTAAQMWLSARV